MKYLILLLLVCCVVSSMDGLHQSMSKREVDDFADNGLDHSMSKRSVSDPRVSRTKRRSRCRRRRLRRG